MSKSKAVSVSKKYQEWDDAIQHRMAVGDAQLTNGLLTQPDFEVSDAVFEEIKKSIMEDPKFWADFCQKVRRSALALAMREPRLAVLLVKAILKEES